MRMTPILETTADTRPPLPRGSVELRTAGAAALEFEEPVVRGGGHDAVPERQRHLALRRRRDDRTEERRPVDGDDRGADVLPDAPDPVFVAGAHLGVVLVAVGVRAEVVGKADLGERAGDDGLLV